MNEKITLNLIKLHKETISKLKDELLNLESEYVKEAIWELRTTQRKLAKEINIKNQIISQGIHKRRKFRMEYLEKIEQLLILKRSVSNEL